VGLDKPEDGVVVVSCLTVTRKVWTAKKQNI